MIQILKVDTTGGLSEVTQVSPNLTRSLRFEFTYKVLLDLKKLILTREECPGLKKILKVDIAFLI